MAISAIVLLARRSGDCPHFLEGYYGEFFREFDKRGFGTVRHLFERNLLSRQEHYAAEVWLGLMEAEKARSASVKTFIEVVAVVLTVLMATAQCSVA